MQVETIKIEALYLDPANVRTHDDRNLDAIKASLKRFGQQKPIVVGKSNEVIAGNGTLEAARALGWKDIRAVKTELARSEATAYAIADNRTAELAAWDDSALIKQLEALQDEDPELFAASGFDAEELDRLIEDAPQADDEFNDSPIQDVPKNPITKPGDVWEMGDHRLFCGDCRERASYEFLGDRKINIGFTSPPYASQRKYDETTEFRPIHPNKYVDWFDDVQARIGEHLAPDGSWFVNIKEHCEDGQRHLYVKDLTIAHVRQWGWDFVDEFCWSHGGTPKAVNQRFKNGWEPVFQFTKSRHKFRPDAVMHPTRGVPDWGGLHPNMEDVQKYGCTEGMGRKGVDSRKLKYSSRRGTTPGPNLAKTQGSRNQDGNWVSSNMMAYPSNVISPGRNKDALGHSAAFPVALPEFFIKAFSDKSDAVFDPFMGSGSTMAAAQKTGRVSYGIEISPAYCDMIIRRWENMTGEKATLSDGDQ